MADLTPKPPQWASASRDDRGRKMHIYRSGFMGLPRWTDDPVPKEEWERIRWAGIPEQYRKQSSRTSWVSLIFLALLVIQAWFRARWYWWELPLMGFLLVAAIVVRCYPHRGWVWYNWVNMVEAMLSHKRCAQCAYPIGDIDAAEDGRVVCPECGAAWFAASVGKPMQEMPMNTVGKL